MALIPEFEPGVWNAWLFMIVFLLQWLAVLFLPRRIAERTSHPADLKQSRKDKIIGAATQIFWIGAILYSVFLPFKTGTAWFYAGLGVFIIGLAVLVAATVNVTRAEADKPFTNGIYRFSRHPMYLAMILIYIGVSIAAVSWLFLLITIITVFLQRQQMIQEENYCRRKFGDEYSRYMSRTPRWIGLL